MRFVLNHIPFLYVTVFASLALVQQAGQSAAKVRRQLTGIAHQVLQSGGKCRILRLLSKSGTAGRLTVGVLAGKLVAQCLLFSLALHRIAGLTALLLALLAFTLAFAPAHGRAAKARHASAGLVAHTLHHLRGLLETLQQRVHL